MQNKQKEQKIPNILIIVSIISCFMGIIATLIMSASPRLSLISMILCFAPLVYVLYRHVQILVPSSYVMPIMMLIPMVQLGVLLNLAIWNVPMEISSSTLAPHVYDNPGLVVFSIGFPIFVTWLVALIIKESKKQRFDATFYESLLGENSKLTNFTLLLIVPLFMAIIYKEFAPGNIGYFFTVISSGTIFISYFAGRYTMNFKMMGFVWVCALSIALLFGLQTGGRYSYIMPILLFVIGFITSLTRRWQVIMTVSMVILSLPAMVVIGILGSVRDQVGRGAEYALQAGRVSTMIEAAQGSVSAVSFSEQKQNFEEQFLKGLMRMIAWPTPAVALLSPQPVDYRGFGDFLGQIKASFYFAGLTGEGRAYYGKYELGNLPANRYGFTVNEDTAVEFGMTPDGWSRGGPLGAFLFVFIFGLFIGLLEKFTFRYFKIPNPYKLILLAILCKMSIDSGAFPFLQVIRATILYYGFFLVIIVFIAFLFSARKITKMVKQSPSEYNYAR